MKYFKDTYISDDERLTIEKRIKEVERYETYLSYLEDAMNICNTKSFGFWQSHSFSRIIDLDGINLNKQGNKVIFSPRESEYKNNLNIVFDSDDEKLGFLRRLSVWLQITRLAYGPQNKIYLKVQLENSSTPFEETRSFNIPGLTYENSRDVQIEIKVRKPGFHDQVKRFNVRQAIDQQEISSFFEMVSED